MIFVKTKVARLSSIFAKAFRHVDDTCGQRRMSASPETTTRNKRLNEASQRRVFLKIFMRAAGDDCLFGDDCSEGRGLGFGGGGLKIVVSCLIG
ncbi:MAG: hypothetical protein WCP55_23395 [Lentisphaerota bacterium]